MAEVKFDLTGQDPAESQARSGDFEEAPKGIYKAVVDEINPGFSKNDDGTPDKKRPRLEVIWKIVGDADGNAIASNYSRIYYYVTFGDTAKWKLDQFLLAFGIATEKKRKGKFKTEDVVGQSAKIRVRPGKNQDGDYRAEIGAVFPWEDPDAAGLDDEDFADDEESFDGGEGDEPGITAEEIDAMKGTELKALVKEHGIEIPKGSKVADVRELVKEALLSDEGDEEDWDDDSGDDADDDVPF